MVFRISVVVMLAFVTWGIVSPNHLAETANSLLGVTIEKFGWLYLLSSFSFLLFALYLAFGKYGHIKLGADDDEPDYSNLTWFGMLFSAGMGIGLVFWGVAEPMVHYVDPPMGIEPGTAEASLMAMRYAFFHWGLHPWAIYTVIALALAYFNFRKGYKGLISQTFHPILQDRVNGPLGKAIDIIAIIATAFGVATSLGLGALQINGGLAYVLGIPNAAIVQVIIISIVTVLYMISATTGLDRGIRILSNTNVAVAGCLLMFVLFLGPTSFLFETFTVTLGGYLQNLVQMSLRLTPFSQGTWIGEWTLFYWAWWIAWAPFVGTFIARVSRGRTIREFVLGVLVVPSVFSFVWFSVFGGTALNFEILRGIDIAGAVAKDITSALFVTLGQLPLGSVVSFIATTLIVTFFITSADSATFVLGMLSSGGDLNPSNGIKLVWGLLQSSVAIVLLLSGGLEGLQTIAIVSALPFALVMIGMCFSVYQALSEEKRKKRK